MLLVGGRLSQQCLLYQHTRRVQLLLSAGFPGDVIDILFEFDQDGQGIEMDGPPLFLTDGVINAVQEFNSGGAALLHSAEISQGNSGGPLVNGFPRRREWPSCCGRRVLLARDR